MSPSYWYEHWLCDPEVSDRHVVIRDAYGKAVMGAYGHDELDAIQRLIAFCDYGLEHHARAR